MKLASNSTSAVRCALAGLVLMAGAQSVAVAGPYIYSIVDLGTLGGSSSSAYAVNNAGQVVGNAFTSGGPAHGAIFTGVGSGNFDLGTLGGLFGQARAISGTGLVVGYAQNAVGQYHGTVYSGTGSANLDLGTLGGNSSAALAVNGAGVVVGQAGILGNSATHATLFSGTGGGNTDLGTLTVYLHSFAHAINDSSQVVGASMTAGNQSRATMFSGTGSGNTDLGTLGGVESSAYAINNAGQVVGAAQNAIGQYRATLFSGSGSGNIDLGTLGGAHSRASANNNLGQVVGWSTTAAVGDEAFLWQFGTGMVNLEDLFDPLVYSGWDLHEASDINDSGQIVGYGTHNGQQRAFLMTLLPTDSSSDIPEPGTLALLGAGLMLAAFSTRAGARRRSERVRTTWAAWWLLATATCSFHGVSHASIVTYSDKASFLSDTGATSATGPLANVGPVSSHVFGTVEIRAQRYFSGPNVSEGVPDVTTRLPGNDIAISLGVGNTSNENLDVRLLGGPAYAFGFDFVEPQFDPNVNATFVDSTFQVNLFNGLTLIDSFSFNAPNDVAAFVGVSSTAAFDNVQIREVVGGAENEFFGQFYTGANATNTGGDVPEPGTLALLGMGLLLLTGLNARRASAFN